MFQVWVSSIGTAHRMMTGRLAIFSREASSISRVNWWTLGAMKSQTRDPDEVSDAPGGDMIDTLTWLMQTSGSDRGGFFATHPGTDDRIAPIGPECRSLCVDDAHRLRDHGGALAPLDLDGHLARDPHAAVLRLLGIDEPLAKADA